MQHAREYATDFGRVKGGFVHCNKIFESAGRNSMLYYIRLLFARNRRATMTAAQSSEVRPSQHAGAAAAPAHQHDHDHHHDHGHHDHAGHGHPPEPEFATFTPAPAERRAPSPLASAGTSRVAKSAGAVALLWVAVAWALGWLGQ